MMTRAILILSLLLFSNLVWAGVWEDLLSDAHLERADIHFDELDLTQVGGAEGISPTYQYLHGDPLRIPFFARTFRQAVLQHSSHPYELALMGMSRLGLSVRRFPDQKDDLTALEKSTEDQVVAAIEKLHKIGGKALTASQKGQLRARLSHLAPELRIVVGRILALEALAAQSRALAFSGMTKKELKAAFAEFTTAPDTGKDALDQPVSMLTRKLMKEADLRVLFRGGLELSHGLQEIAPELEKVKITHRDQFTWTTPLGEIIIDSRETNNVYHGDKPYLLILDWDGDDMYFGGGATYDSEHSVSVLIDVHGNDKYLGAPELSDKKPWQLGLRKSGSVRPAFGAGVLGYGALIDISGNDSYKAFRQTEGRGNFGFGLLWDKSGTNKFECWVQCQGSGEFGMGLLLDQGGDDVFESMQQAQGFGGPRGVGLLVKPGEGSDQYTAVEDPNDFVSGVDQKRGESFVQGAALGKRAEATDGFSLAGGFGALVDGGGANVFKAGFFAQGIAYWYGVGLLSVGDGADKYHAGKYALGAATHFAVGIFHDTGGDDEYEVDQELGLGHGHDYAVGFFIDDAGNDTYRAPNFSLGCASAQGIGIFWDRAGDDKYSSDAADILGCASPRIDAPSLRFHSRTTGLFLDSGGHNVFKTKLKSPSGSVSSSSWVHQSAEVPVSLPEKIRARFVGAGLCTRADSPEDPD